MERQGQPSGSLLSGLVKNHFVRPASSTSEDSVLISQLSSVVLTMVSLKVLRPYIGILS